MSPTLTYPGVYLEEMPAGARTIESVPTSIAAFIGRSERGPVNEPLVIRGPADFDRLFGGLWADSTMSYSVWHYFENGGSQAVVVRVHNGGVAATFTFQGPAGTLVLEAASPGIWANNLDIEVDHQTFDPDDDTSFNLTIREVVDGTAIAEEVFHNLSTRKNNERYVGRVLEQQSALVRGRGDAPAGRPRPGVPSAGTDGSDGEKIGFAQIADPGLETVEEGIWAFDKGDIFNLFCIPPFATDTDVDVETWTAAQEYCGKYRALLIIDPPSSWIRPSDVVDGEKLTGSVPRRNRNAAVFFPRVRIANPLNDNQLETFAPCGVIAGTYARIDARRGVWKAPAGLEATLIGVDGLGYDMTESENEVLDRLGVNCLRSFPGAGCVIWGARTTESADRVASEWKYVNVRRLALFIEESIRRGLDWAVFEPTDAALRSKVRSHVGSLMAQLFREGAFAAQMPSEAYDVRCDSDTTTENDINEGVINVDVGFAPLRPAEFVWMRISLNSHY